MFQSTTHGEFKCAECCVEPSREDEMKPSKGDKLNGRLYPMEGRVREGQTRVPQTFTKVNLSASPSQKLYRRLHTSPKSNAQIIAMNGNA